MAFYPEKSKHINSHCQFKAELQMIDYLYQTMEAQTKKFQGLHRNHMANVNNHLQLIRSKRKMPHEIRCLMRSINQTRAKLPLPGA